MPPYLIVLIPLLALITLVLLWFGLTIFVFKTKQRILDIRFQELNEALTAYYDALTRLCRAVHVFGNQDTAFYDLIAWRMQISEPLDLQMKETYLEKMLHLKSRLVDVIQANPSLLNKPMMVKLLDDQAIAHEKLLNAKRRHNARVSNYNATIKVFPNNAVSRIFGLDVRRFFRTELTDPVHKKL